MTNSITVAVSNRGTQETWKHQPPFRTAEQFAAVKSIINSPEFHFSCNSMIFDPDKPSSFQRTFTWHVSFDHDPQYPYLLRLMANGEIHCCSFQTLQILKEVVMKAHENLFAEHFKFSTENIFEFKKVKSN